MNCNHESVQQEKGPFPYDSGTDDGPVLLDYVVVCTDCFAIVRTEPNLLGSFGKGWSGSIGKVSQLE